MPESAVLSPPRSQEGLLRSLAVVRRFDLWLVLGIGAAAAALVAGILGNAIALQYFLQPAGLLLVAGGTLAVSLITTPPVALAQSLRRVAELFLTPVLRREELIEELARCSLVARRNGILALEKYAEESSNEFLRHALLMALDVGTRADLQTALETHMRLRERAAEGDAKTFEVAGGFAPTIGIMGTVVGLIGLLRQFSNVQAVGAGIGMAFVSTLYGLALANLFLLPLAYRIRARAAERFELEELMTEGVLSLVDGVHPALMRRRLSSFLRDWPPPNGEV